MPESKRCHKCNVTKPLDQFKPNKHMRSGYFNQCRECDRAYRRQHYIDNREKYQAYSQAYAPTKRVPDHLRKRRPNGLLPVSRPARRRMVKYGLTPEDFAAMVEIQADRCLICGSIKMLVVDHDHQTGKVRGLLCNPCNTGLGFFRDDRDRLRSAIEYLSQ